MSDLAGKQSRAEEAHAVTSTAAPSPGKRTLVEHAYAALVQRHGAAPASDDGAVHAAAARGTATPSTALPHADQIQRAFGRHDVSSVQAHTGEGAAASARDMGAQAYASGNHVVLGDGGGDLFTVAHEAAHVVQQRGGVQLKGGVGAEGDVYERHADEVATQVVQGTSAESLLDRFAGAGTHAAAGTGATLTQRRINVGGKQGKDEHRKLIFVGGTDLVTESDAETAWTQIQTDPLLKGIEQEAKAVLVRWVTQAAAYDDRSEVSEHRGYASYPELARALAGEVGSKAALGKEKQLATSALNEATVNAAVGSFLGRLLEVVDANKDALAPTNAGKGRYRDWAYGDKKTTFAMMFANPPGTLLPRMGLIADYALAARGPFQTAEHFQMPDDAKASRSTPHNTDESAPWTQEARQKGVALSAGPSATTPNVLALATAIGAPQEEINALAWGLFAIWNIMPMHQSGTHRFHEVMAIAASYNVPYQLFEYPDQVPTADFQAKNDK